MEKKLTDKQKEIFMVLLAVESYEEDEKERYADTWEKYCKLELDVTYDDFTNKIEDLKVLQESGLIEFEYEERSREEIDEELGIEVEKENEIISLKIKDNAEKYFDMMNQPAFRKIIGMLKEGITIDSLIKFEFNGIKVG